MGYSSFSVSLTRVKKKALPKCNGSLRPMITNMGRVLYNPTLEEIAPPRGEEMALTSLVVASPPAAAAAAAWRRRRREAPRPFLVAASSGSNSAPMQQLREQLLQLRAEADLTQSKANSARVRLVRLTEAAENLKKRAATNVQMGKENEAVDLLVQKKKLMQALENLKERTEVLDKLSAKINEAISMKQNMLIEHALHPEIAISEDSNEQIRVFSGNVAEVADKTRDSFPKSVEKDSSEMKTISVHANMVGDFEQRKFGMTEKVTFFNDYDIISSIKSPSSYSAFLEYIDSQLKSLENEIEKFISSQLVEMEGDQKQINSEQQKLSDILRGVLEIRERISSIVDTTQNDTKA